ncbi:sensor histidine kinase [Legionella sp. CNM-1927-20]|uniref:sensor histidine kinase n=1 Tax=Legionella sp. CNM-1927-20 TaxID=3422221 RepID=UPI00403B3338
MKNKSQSIRSIFIKKMAYSAVIQFFVFGLFLILIHNYFQIIKINTLYKNLIINDSFTTEEIGRYQLLNNKDALDLTLYNLENERKLDSIKFIAFPQTLENLGTCQSIQGSSLLVCRGDNGQFSGVTTIKIDDKIIGYVVAKKLYNSIYSMPVSYSFLFMLLIVVGIFLFNFLFLFLSMRKSIANNTRYLLKFISSQKKDNDPDLSRIGIEEYRQIAVRFIEEHSEIIKLQKEKAYYEIRKNIAEQVAHDIRSPLAAINTAVFNVTSLPENKRVMIRNAAKRINDIANNLLIQSKNNFIDEDTLKHNLAPELIYVVLDNIVAEKRYEYYKSNISFTLNGSNDSYHCFSNIDLNSFKRILSNLINNSIEAIKSNGSIIISLTCSDTDIELIIEDNGCGISADILPKITEKGFSFNKENGAGLGLFYVKQYIEKLNGRMVISSKVNIGTKIIINLIRTQSPDWFCEVLNIKQDSVVVILDDDPSIHEAWNERLVSFSNIKIKHFCNGSELFQYKADQFLSTLYLIDYELLDGKNGLDIIEELKLNDRALLVTSCFEDSSIRNRCENLGIKIIPKSYVPYIQIAIVLNNDFDNKIVLIDDEEIIREAWALAAEEAGEDITTYSSFNNFMLEINNYSKDTIIYIDSELGENIKGEIYAKYLFENGFTKIYLATGYPTTQFNSIPWVKAVVGKEPIFYTN